eukprot:g3566.t1
MGIRKNKGRWTREEHLAFLRGLYLYDRTWEAVASLVPTRSVLQIRTHSQKYFAKIESGGVFPEEPYPSQYDAAAGKAGAGAGAYLYEEPQERREQQKKQQQKQQQQQQERAQLVGGNGAIMADALSSESPPLPSQPDWDGGGGGDYRAEVEPGPPHPGLPVVGEQQHESRVLGPFEAASGVGARAIVRPPMGAFPSGWSGDTSGSGSGNGSPDFGVGFSPWVSAGAASDVCLNSFGRSSGAPYPAKRGSATSPLDSDDKYESKRNGTDIRRPRRSSTVASASAATFPSSSSFSSSSAGALTAFSTPSSQSFACADLSVAAAPAVGYASGLPAADLANTLPASFAVVGSGSCQQSMAGAEQIVGITSCHQSRAGLNQDLEAGFPEDGASFKGSGPGGGHDHDHHHHYHHQSELDAPPVVDGQMWSISRDHEIYRAEKRAKTQRQETQQQQPQQQQQQQQQYDVFDRATRRDAPQEQEWQAQQDLLPFYGWFEDGVGAGGGVGDVFEDEKGEIGNEYAYFDDSVDQPPMSFGVL